MQNLYTPAFRFFVCTAILCFLSATTFASKEKWRHQNLQQYIPAGYQLLDSASGDLNSDGYIDYIMVLKNKKEDKAPAEARPLMLLMGTAKGSLELLARNDKVVLCSNCGGLFGDPYSKIRLIDSTVLIEHTIGATWKWSRIISFKFDKEINSLVLSGDESFSFNAYNNYTQIQARPSTKTSIDKTPFIYFSYTNGY